MTDKVIQANDVWKQYRLGVFGHRMLTRDLQSWWARVRGKEDPNSRLFDPRLRSNNEHFWALREVSFEVARGDCLGVIGSNGAGKSTLLKILSRVTAPTRGSLKIKGRIASLLEVGTGFHPELTGRENVYLNGTILGMSKREITARFEEIVDFSGVEQFIDTPVKRYSSGMYVRLAFAVAAHLTPEVLIVDEVLAVGDARFQKKCLGKMQDVGREGRTVIFVSHNMQAIKNLCRTGLYLEDGRVAFMGGIDEAVQRYTGTVLQRGLRDDLPVGTIYREEDATKGGFHFREIQLREVDGEPKAAIHTLDSFVIRLVFHSPYAMINGSVAIFIKDMSGKILMRFLTRPDSGLDVSFKEGLNVINCRIKQFPLTAGSYLVEVGLADAGCAWLCSMEGNCILMVDGQDIYGSGFIPNQQYSVAVSPAEWEIG